MSSSTTERQATGARFLAGSHWIVLMLALALTAMNALHASGSARASDGHWSSLSDHVVFHDIADDSCDQSGPDGAECCAVSKSCAVCVPLSTAAIVNLPESEDIRWAPVVERFVNPASREFRPPKLLTRI